MYFNYSAKFLREFCSNYKIQITFWNASQIQSTFQFIARATCYCKCVAWQCTTRKSSHKNKYNLLYWVENVDNGVCILQCRCWVTPHQLCKWNIAVCLATTSAMIIGHQHSVTQSVDNSNIREFIVRNLVNIDSAILTEWNFLPFLCTCRSNKIIELWSVENVARLFLM